MTHPVPFLARLRAESAPVSALAALLLVFNLLLPAQMAHAGGQTDAAVICSGLGTALAPTDAPGTAPAAHCQKCVSAHAALPAAPAMPVRVVQAAPASLTPLIAQRREAAARITPPARAPPVSFVF